ncbi:MAG: ParB/RepB/Spo0J family partition protein, partial [Bacteroidia bacterium]|nr:ParB/RepB/Spo0J family partition protein [Bacteroidia bacterium]
GKGLSALLEDISTDITSNTEFTSESIPVAGNITGLPLDKIEANPFQPRSTFEEQALNELAASIREQGIIQPITVRKLGYDRFQIISGERRFRASQLAGLKSIPAYIRIANDQAMLEMSLVENIQRENLNAIEIGISYKRLVDECSLTQDDVSKRVGKDRTTVTNYIRLLKLPPEIQIAIRDNKISMGHARSIVNVDDPVQQLVIFRDIIGRQLSVRETEGLVRTHSGRKSKKNKGDSTGSLPFEYRKIQNVLTSQFESKVEVKLMGKEKGKIIIPFDSTDDLNRVLEKLNY